MRFIRSVHVHVPAPARDDYFALLREMEALCRESDHVRGFYMMENADRDNEFWEFYEFADEAAGSAFAADRAARAITVKIAQIVPDELSETSFWQQRI